MNNREYRQQLKEGINNLINLLPDEQVELILAFTVYTTNKLSADIQAVVEQFEKSTEKV